MNAFPRRIARMLSSSVPRSFSYVLFRATDAFPCYLSLPFIRCLLFYSLLPGFAAKGYY